MFVHNGQRRAVWRGFQEYLELIKPLGRLNVIYVNGGFVTDKTHPTDVDIIIEYRNGRTRFELQQTFWFLRLRPKVKDKYLVDILSCLVNQSRPNLIDFFQHLRPQDATDRGVTPDTEKGILRIKLR